MFFIKRALSQMLSNFIRIETSDISCSVFQRLELAALILTLEHFRTCKERDGHFVRHMFISLGNVHQQLNLHIRNDMHSKKFRFTLTVYKQAANESVTIRNSVAIPTYFSKRF
jgi:hypothetical protein